MFKFKKSTISILLCCVIVISVIFVFSAMYNIHELNHLEAFSLRKTFNSQKRKLRNFNNRQLTKYRSKLNRFFKSVF